MLGFRKVAGEEKVGIAAMRGNAVSYSNIAELANISELAGAMPAICRHRESACALR
jgi:hypothetical protein